MWWKSELCSHVTRACISVLALVYELKDKQKPAQGKGKIFSLSVKRYWGFVRLSMACFRNCHELSLQLKRERQNTQAINLNDANNTRISNHIFVWPSFIKLWKAFWVFKEKGAWIYFDAVYCYLPLSFTWCHNLHVSHRKNSGETCITQGRG